MLLLKIIYVFRTAYFNNLEINEIKMNEKIQHELL